jgi:chemotaxis protein histidine kinase CheA
MDAQRLNDTAIVDRLHEPLAQAMRRSTDHGLEAPAHRVGAGKIETRTITLSATPVGGDVHISSDQVGMSVDEVLDQRQVVMKALHGQSASIRRGFGGALLASGFVGLLLGCERLAEGMRNS